MRHTLTIARRGGWGEVARSSLKFPVFLLLMLLAGAQDLGIARHRCSDAASFASLTTRSINSVSKYRCQLTYLAFHSCPKQSTASQAAEISKSPEAIRGSGTIPGVIRWLTAMVMPQLSARTLERRTHANTGGSIKSAIEPSREGLLRNIRSC